MFTQCSKCETVFRLSADALRAAGGQVRCGRCGEVFNALSRLAEDATGFIKGESPLFLETRAEEILESSSFDLSDPPVDIESSAALDDAEHRNAPDLPPGVEVVQLQFIGPVDDELADETSLEFTLPPGELDRIFVETRPSPLQQLAADSYREERADVTPLHPEALALHSEDGPSSPEALPPHPEALAAHANSPPAHPESSPEVIAASMVVPPAPPLSTPAVPAQSAAPVKLPQGPAPPVHAPASRVAGLEVSEAVRQEMLSSLRTDTVRNAAQSRTRSGSKPESPAQPRGQTSRVRLPFAAWLSAALVLGILLVIQVVRGNSNWVAVHMPLLGGSGPAANLSMYQLRQWGVTGDPAAKGTLRVRASIMNTAPELQAYPLLRVTLVNRFGARVGAREFEPAEYLGHGIARMLAPGERVDATLDILDPGKDAEGFEIDVCIRSTDKKLFCAGDAAAQAK